MKTREHNRVRNTQSSIKTNIMNQQGNQTDIQTTTIIYQITDSQLREFARNVIEEARDNMAAEVQRCVADAVGNRADYCSFDEACERTGKTRQTISAWVRKGRLHPVKNGKKVLFLRSEIVKEAGL